VRDGNIIGCVKARPLLAAGPSGSFLIARLRRHGVLIDDRKNTRSVRPMDHTAAILEQIGHDTIWKWIGR
jgi:hypothetical protein